MIVNSSKTRTGFLKCQLCLSFKLNANYSGENIFDLAVVVLFLFFNFQIHLRNRYCQI